MPTAAQSKLLPGCLMEPPAGVAALGVACEDEADWSRGTRTMGGAGTLGWTRLACRDGGLACRDGACWSGLARTTMLAGWLAGRADPPASTIGIAIADGAVAAAAIATATKPEMRMR